MNGISTMPGDQARQSPLRMDRGRRGVPIHLADRCLASTKLALVACCLLANSARAGSPDAAALEAAYAQRVQPLMARICHDCHSTDQAEAEIDFSSQPTWAEVRRQPRTWQKVREMLTSGQMPPPDAPQPSEEERAVLVEWVRSHLQFEALATAGDPGRVVLRRLSNAEYTSTLRDLTGIDSLDPAREFPIDGAAGEGFTNTGSALVMSPALVTKYLDAAKEVAAHAVLLPDGFRFSPRTSRRDWSEEILGQIREFYGRYSDAGGGTRVLLQGLEWDTNQGGRLPLERYLAATLAHRSALQEGVKSIEEVAAEFGLNAKYLGILWRTLADEQPSLLLDHVRALWRAAAADGAPHLAAEILKWQQALFQFTSVGHIGKVGGPKAWQQPVLPLVEKQELRVPLETPVGAKELVVYLVTTDAGDGNTDDVAIWERPRLVAPSRPELLLRDVRDFTREMTARRGRLFANTSRALRAAAAVERATGLADIPALAKAYDVEEDSLATWLSFLGIGSGAKIELDLFTERQNSAAGYDFVKGWGKGEAPSLVANSSDQHVRIPGNMKPHGVCVHPTPDLAVAAGWQSPLAGNFRVSGQVTHAHPECGNGVSWSLELRRGTTRQRLSNGTAHGGTPQPFGPVDVSAVQPGDLVSLLIGPREGNHACDLTDIELVIEAAGDDARKWSLTADVANDVLAGNPHPDRYGIAGVWHFYTEPVDASETGTVVPAGSLLARWQSADSAAQKDQLAEQIEALLTNGPAAGIDEQHPDVVLYRQLSSLGGPLFASGWTQVTAAGSTPAKAAAELKSPTQPESLGDIFGFDPATFGKHPDGSSVDAQHLCVQAPAVIEVRLPADIATGAELVTSVGLHPATGGEGSIQVQVLMEKPTTTTGLLETAVAETRTGESWTANRRGVAHATPVVVQDGSPALQRMTAAFDAFRSVFPPALCYTRIVPVDEVVTLTLLYREDEELKRLFLSEAEVAHLDRMWDELHYVSHDALTLVDAFAQLMEYATQDADPSVFAPMSGPIHERAEVFRRRLVETEPAHLNSLVDFAARLYRRPLTADEARELGDLYQRLRSEELPHDEAFRLTLARVLVAPDFLYRVEVPGPGSEPSAISDHELANRLSYFLWASSPDEELRLLADEGRLRQPDMILEQTRRMVKSDRVRRLAIEFGCQWLHIRDFDQLDEKSERHFPEFAGLRGVMYEESIQFFTHLFAADRSVLDLLRADYTFVNKDLAKFYDIPGVSGEQWRRVEGASQLHRGGILAQASTLARQSGASRTSPILRGNWVSEVLLGERLPRPPKDVPVLPETAPEGLTERQLIERHSSDPACAKCHARIDPFGFALESFDAVGRFREHDTAGLPIDTTTRLKDGTGINGLDGLRSYLADTRRDDFVRQFCRKLVGYALGRSVQLSDEPLLESMQRELAANDYRVSSAVEMIVTSPQFLNIRGQSAANED